jgi:phage gpG-like protein
MSVEITDMLTPALLDKLARITDPLPVLRAAGAALAAASTRTFREPDFRPAPWAPLKPETLKRKKGRGGILIDNALLWRSILAAEPSGNEVEVGTDRTYALFHQFGTRRMPARPFIPVQGDTLAPRAAESVAEAMGAAIAALLAD